MTHAELNFFSPANSQIYNGRKGTREASKSLLQPSVHFTQLWPSHQQLPEDWEYKPPSHVLHVHVGSNYSRGFHIFILIFTFDWNTFPNQKAELCVEQFAARSGLNVRTFFTEKHLWPIKHISEYISMFSVGHK